MGASQTDVRSWYKPFQVWFNNKAMIMARMLINGSVAVVEGFKA